MIGVVKNAENTNNINKLGLLITEDLQKTTKNKTVYETTLASGERIELGTAKLEGKNLGFHIQLPTALQKQGIASEIFNKAINKYNPKAILGNWINSPGLDANFNAYMKNMTNNMTESEAAINTATGNMAKNNGR